jgi:hypothetical protein
LNSERPPASLNYGKEKKSEGCLNSERAGQLLLAIEKLKSAPIK